MSVHKTSKNFDFDSKRIIAKYDAVKIPYEVMEYNTTTTETIYEGNTHTVVEKTAPETVCVYDGNVIAKLLSQVAERCDFGLGGNLTIEDLVANLNRMEVVGNKVLIVNSKDNAHYDLSRDAAGKFDLL